MLAGKCLIMKNKVITKYEFMLSCSTLWIQEGVPWSHEFILKYRQNPEDIQNEKERYIFFQHNSVQFTSFNLGKMLGKNT